MLLSTLYGNLSSKDKIPIGKRVQRVKSLRDRVQVVTADGEELAGDLLIGADGVYSVIRQEMWRLAEEVQSAPCSRNDWDGECWILKSMSMVQTRTNMEMSKTRIVRTNASSASPIH